VNEKSKILLIEDDIDIAEMLNQYFRNQGYEVITSNWGEDGIRAVNSNRPDLILLDIRLPDIDGYEVARRLRADRKTNTIPIIFLTERRDRADRLQGLELGGDDYITKPFDIQELRLRVANAIRRAKLDTLTNPVSGLPEGDIVLERIRETLQKENWAIVLISLLHVDAFREKYGFVTSDDVIRAISLMINNIIHESKSKENFVGHLTATDLVIMVDPVAANYVEDQVRLRLEKSMSFFYPVTDLDLVVIKEDRIAVQTSHVSSIDGRFVTFDEVKAELYKRRK